jgi:hypothetical protein
LLPHRLVFAFRGDALLAASDSLNVIDVSEAYRAVTGWIGPISTLTAGRAETYQTG